MDFRHYLYACCNFRRTKVIAHSKSDDPIQSLIHAGIGALHSSRSATSFIIADFGSSHGRTSIRTMQSILEYLRQTNKFVGTPFVIHIDIPTNNWSKMFQLLTNENPYYGYAMGRSFYEQCFPDKSISIGFSSAALHYLSRRPCHLTKHCYFRFATPTERKIFEKQSKFDLDVFLACRSRELISGGILLLNIPCVGDNGDMDFDAHFDLIYQCVQLLSLLTSDELLHFTIPFYLRSLSECVDFELFHRHSLKLVKVEFVCLKSSVCNQYQHGHLTRDQYARSLTMMMRPGTEFAFKQALLSNGRSSQDIEDISTQFWQLYEEKVKETIDKRDLKTYATLLVLRKK
ncbi:unnamed protein product [Adineta ricciae]|uniref:Uncharacterized protein n=1 Tax=Adineta ricciae TaxID=249248 RepID=A0A814UA82_ADIRI|nr:unnamed protein product [Adineta ricciae]